MRARSSGGCSQCGRWSQIQPKKIRLGGGRRSASLWEMDELDGNRRRNEERGGHVANERYKDERRQMRHWPTGAAAAENTVLGVPMVARVMVVAGVHEKLRRKAFRADLDRERPVACGHEALRDERAHGERKQQYAGDQLMLGFLGQTQSHCPLQAYSAAQALIHSTPAADTHLELCRKGGLTPMRACRLLRSICSD
jgi:hypothetical protein